MRESVERIHDKVGVFERAEKGEVECDTHQQRTTRGRCLHGAGCPPVDRDTGDEQQRPPGACRDQQIGSRDEQRVAQTSQDQQNSSRDERAEEGNREQQRPAESSRERQRPETAIE